MRIIRRNRIGNNTEDITFTPATGKLGETVAIMDGYSVLGLSFPALVAQTQQPPQGGGLNLPRQGAGFGQPSAIVEIQESTSFVDPEKRAAGSEASVTKLFDLHGLNIFAGPRGIAYLESEGLYVLDEPNQPSTLFLVDNAGNFQGTRAVNYLGGFEPQHVEGIAYLPRTSRQFPDHLVMVTLMLGPVLESRLQVLRRDGQVVKEIRPQAPVGSRFITGVCFKAPDQLLVSSDDDNTIHTLDFNGNIVNVSSPAGQPPAQLPLHGIEGLVQLPGDPRGSEGFVAAAGYDDGVLVLVPADLNTPPRRFRYYQIGLGFSNPVGLAWDSTHNQHLVLSYLRGHPPTERYLSAVAPTLTSGKTLTSVGPARPRLTYLPDEKLTAVVSRVDPPAILLYDDQGRLVEEIDIPTAVGNPFVITYLPTTREFVLRVTQQLATLFFLSRKGANVTRTLDLKPAGIRGVFGLTFFNPKHPSGGQFLLIDFDNQAVVIDLNGTKLAEFNTRTELNLAHPLSVSAITTGPDAGAFGIADTDNSEIVVFRLD